MRALMNWIAIETWAGALLLTWIDFNPIMDWLSHTQGTVRLNNLAITKLQRRKTLKFGNGLSDVDSQFIMNVITYPS